MKPSLNVAEHFISLQGESSFAGKICFFLRLSGCNLRCSYCDTTFAQTKDSFQQLTINEIVTTINKSNIELIEITGGEPLLQSEAVNALSEILIKNRKTVLIETNGSVLINKIPEAVIKIVDVKTPSSNEANSFNIENLKMLNHQDEIKFVIADRADFDFAAKFTKKHNLEKIVDNIIFSPVWGKINFADLAEWLIAENLPVRMQLQLHKIIWGPDKQGV